MEHKTASADEHEDGAAGEASGGLDARVGRIVRQTLADQVYGDLKEILLAGRAAPGERFTLRGLASAIGTSAMPVREAVSRLVAENALEVLPNRAVRVPLMPRARFRELRLIRCSLEGLATEIAVREATDAEVAEVERFERLFAAERDKPEPDGAVAMCHNKDLHFALYRAAHLPTLFQMIEGLWLQIGPVLNLDFRAGPDRVRMGEAHIRHAAMVAALKARDSEAARTALVADIWSAGDFILSRDVLPD
ncbi:GntR family transcriptional regulator [Xanthobacter oligotrophicus]|uniref:GntR family transcriptional regulator n=1 Tax=Xanthobacter oligotrophicus TaxID=2607286 RepID=UPI0011F2AB2A|nr:GntR family transcriptional regulator [Xanthobacter oligotrophicus]MCG5235537.1 GntR family transcriptional regulator [Xanthobacter oligotrophicus]